MHDSGFEGPICICLAYSHLYIYNLVSFSDFTLYRKRRAVRLLSDAKVLPERRISENTIRYGFISPARKDVRQ